MSEPKPTWDEIPDDEPAIDPRVLVSLLRAYTEARTERDNYGRRVDSLAKMLKQYLEAHPEEVLWDGENRIEARLQNRSGGETYDLVSIHASNPALFERLYNTGCLMVDAAAVKAQRDQVAGVEKYAMPKKGTTALIVEEKN